MTPRTFLAVLVLLSACAPASEQAPPFDAAQATEATSVTPTSSQSGSSALSTLPVLRNYTNHRVSSHDRTGANDDGNWQNPIQVGETRTIAEIDGPGIISHIWITISTPEKHHLKKIVLRMFWDGESTPSVETPIGDFFGLGLGEYFLYESAALSVGSQKALNSFFPMPFRQSARITVTHEGDQAISAFYYNIDYERHDRLPDDLGYFHAQYRQGTPNPGWTTDWMLNGDDLAVQHRNPEGADNYVLLISSTGQRGRRSSAPVQRTIISVPGVTVDVVLARLVMRGQPSPSSSTVIR